MRSVTKAASLAIALSLAAGAAAAADYDSPEVKARIAAKHWAYQPVQPPSVPTVKNAAWVRTPIDAFILAKLEEQNLKPSPDADRVTFIRRATLDVTGVIPTPEEVKDFVNDKSPNAYEKVVDRLLSSPRYGERQGRRWLDLARYADSTGFQGDQTRRNNFRYRDYVIASFNQDKPFDRFVKEQLAGDELWPDSHEAKIATGFLAGYPDNYNSRDLVQRKYQIETDITDTVGQALLAQTLGCARCHNHKHDKISQKDYFSFQAFFANVAFNDKVPAPKGPQEVAFEEAEAKWQAATKDIRARQKEILEPFQEKGRKYYKERYLTDSREAIFKDEKDWTPLDRWVNHRLNFVASDRDIAQYLRLASEGKDFPDYNPENVAKWEEYKKLDAELKKFDNLRPTGSKNLTTAFELGTQAPPTFIRFSGIHERPTEEVKPAFLSAVTTEAPVITPTANSTGRRTALANWIASAENPLTARVFVNRIWAQHFGRGIVETVSDFGKAGSKPTHPELLEYLADNFVKNGWSVKKLHRDILLSSVYRQSSDPREDAVKADVDNKLLALFPRKRLESEEVRDSLLIASGQLNETHGGPSVFPPLPAAVNPGDSVFDGNALWVASKDPKDHNRRSVYVFVRRSVPYPMLDVFNAPNPQLVHSKREVTTSPLQALTLFNNDIVFSWSQHLAGRVIREAGNNESAQVDRLFQILYGRNPDKTEKATLLSFLNEQEKLIRDKESANGTFALNVPKDVKVSNPVRAAAFVDLVHTAVNANEFIYRF